MAAGDTRIDTDALKSLADDMLKYNSDLPYHKGSVDDLKQCGDVSKAIQAIPGNAVGAYQKQVAATYGAINEFYNSLVNQLTTLQSVVANTGKPFDGADQSSQKGVNNAGAPVTDPSGSGNVATPN